MTMKAQNGPYRLVACFRSSVIPGTPVEIELPANELVSLVPHPAKLYPLQARTLH
jgi:hypothetical protein